MGLLDGGAELFERGYMHVDGPRSYGTTTRHGNTGATGARDQRTQYQARGAHGLDDIVGRFGPVEMFGVDAHRSGLPREPRARVFEQALHGGDIFHARNTPERDRLFS